MKVTLRMYSSASILSYTLSAGEKVTIGRSRKCDWMISDEQASSHHCVITLHKNRMEIMDMGSKNGTFLNSIQIDQADIFIGDQVKVGKTIIGLNKNDADVEAQSFLTFPGPKGNHFQAALEKDFDSVRKTNQLQQNIRRKNSIAEKSHLREIQIRRNSQSELKLSKEEIRKKNKLRSFWTYIVDTLFIVFCSLLIAEAFSSYKDKINSQFNQSAWFFIIFILGFSLFYAFNFIYLNYTFGEILTGIKSLHLSQERKKN